MSGTGCPAKTPRTGRAAAATNLCACVGVTVLGPAAKTTPRYEAPAPAETSTSSARVRPQILTLTPMSRHAGKLPEQLLRRAAPGQSRADQHRVRTRGRGLSYIHPP